MQKFPLLFEKGHLFIPIHEQKWVIDTGSPLSFGDESSLTLDQQEFEIEKNLRSNTAESISKLIGVACTGLLGADILNEFDIIFDVASNELILSTEELSLEGEEIEIDNLLGIPIIPLIIAEEELSAFFDTGAQISYYLNPSIYNYPQKGKFRDFVPTVGEFEVDTFSVPVSIGDINISLQFGDELPESLRIMLVLIEKKAIVGNELMQSCKVGYFPRRDTIVFKNN